MVLPHDDVGEGPVLLLMHAGIADRTMWSEHLQPLAAAGFRVVAPDLPEFGEADAPSQEYAPWNEVLATMDALGIEQATLVGNSLGGAVALRVAVLAPQRVNGLALISAPAPGIDPSPELAAVWEAEELAIEREDISAAVEVILNAWLAPDAPEVLRARVGAMQRRAFELQMAGAEVPEGDDPLDGDPDALARLDIPVLIAVGQHDLPDFHLAADAFAETFAHGCRAELAGIGHLTPLEAPEEFRELLLTFLR